MCFFVTVPCHTSLSMCHHACSGCIEGLIPHDLTLLFEKQKLMHKSWNALVDEALRVKYVAINRIFHSITIL